MKNIPRKICIVAGGTGGHIIPAIAFGQWLKHRHAIFDIEYISGSRINEKEIYSAHGICAIQCPISGSPFGVSDFFEKLIRWKQIIFSLFFALFYLYKNKPDVVLLFGGYLSLPFLIAGKISKKKMFLHEQNVKRGRVTRLAFRFGVEILETWDVNSDLQSVYVGMPLRKFKILPKIIALEKLGLPKALRGSCIVGVLGGSLGSPELVECIMSLSRDPFFEKWNFVIMGERREDICRNVHVVARSWDPSLFYSIINVALTRAGGSTLAELHFYHIPAVIIPLDKSSEKHQLENAIFFSKISEAVVSVKDENVLKSSISLIYNRKNNKKNICQHDNNYCYACRRIYDIIK